MATRFTRIVISIATVSVFIPITLIAQVQRDIIPLRPWPTPLYWQPTQAEHDAAAMLADLRSDASEMGIKKASALALKINTLSSGDNAQLQSSLRACRCDAAGGRPATGDNPVLSPSRAGGIAAPQLGGIGALAEMVG